MPETFGKRLKKLLKSAKLSQQNVADALGVQRNTVWRWVNDKATPESNLLYNLATLLHISVDDLINDNSTQPSGWVLNIRIAHTLEQEVIDLSKGVPRIATITTSKDGGLLTLGGSYENWTDDNAFKKLIADLKKYRSAVIQNGIALGGIKD